MDLTLQDKLALMMTSAGSQRNLASVLGVTHQKVGRWLREGEAGGVKEIPPEAAEIIDVVFAIHKQVTREQAQIDRIPYFKDVPVYAQRRPLRTGLPGDRVVAKHTEFIRRDLRMDYFYDIVESERFYSASIRSTIDLKRYGENIADVEIEAQRRRKGSRNKIAAEFVKSFANKHGIEDVTEPHPLYTRMENVSWQLKNDPMIAVRGLEEKLIEKHEPATGVAKTHLADEYLLQLLPANYVRPTKQGDAVITRKQPKKRPANKGRTRR